MNEKIVRMLRAYERDPDDALIGEWRLEADAGALHEIFGLGSIDETYGSWPVAAQHVRELQTFVLGHEIDLSHFDYFVEAELEE
jgi:hypothetical protein